MERNGFGGVFATFSAHVNRRKKFGDLFFRFSFYFCFSVWAYFVLKDKDWVPWEFGGQGNVS